MLKATLAVTPDLVQQAQARAQAVPHPTFPEELPVSARREEIAKVLTEHQVVIVCEETGTETDPWLRPMIPLSSTRPMNAVSISICCNERRLFGWDFRVRLWRGW